MPSDGETSKRLRLCLVILVVVLIFALICTFCMGDSKQRESMASIGSGDVRFGWGATDNGPLTPDLINQDINLGHDPAVSGWETNSSRRFSSAALDEALDEREEVIRNKQYTRNSARGGPYKRFSFRDGVRGGGIDEVRNDSVAGVSRYDRTSRFFDNQSPLDDNNDNADDGMVRPFNGIDSNYESVPLEPRRRLTDADKFDTTRLLPREINPDWQDPTDNIEVESSLLIPLHRPVGINTTVGNTRNASRDIRGTPVVEKLVLGPFNNSALEPDINIRGNFLCHTDA